MVRYVMTLILAVGRNMKLIMKLNICLMPLKKIQEINYTYGYLDKPTKKNLVEGNNIFISQRVGDRYGLLIEK